MSPTAATGADWTPALALTALTLSVAVLLHSLSAAASAYRAAPAEVALFLDTADSSIAENESYERDLGRVPCLEDKIRLSRLLRDIQRCGDELREELNALLVAEDGAVLRLGARVMWGSRRAQLEGRVRRLDQLRMRFLVVYMGAITSAAAKNVPAAMGRTMAGARGDLEKALVLRDYPDDGARDESEVSARADLTKALAEGVTKRPPLRRLTTQAIGHNNDTEGSHKKGWFGVVQELQRSPKMHQRHASIEGALSKSPSPITPSSIKLQRAATMGVKPSRTSL